MSYPSVVVPAIPPKPPVLSLIGSSPQPDNSSDPSINGLDLIPEAQRINMPAELWAELQERVGEEWVRGFTYAPENHYAPETRDPCDFSSVDDPPLPAPSGLTLTQVTGSLSGTAFEYQVVAKDANGHTTPCTLVPITIVTGHGVKLVWDSVRDDCTYDVYGRVSGSVGKLATVGPFNPDDGPPTYTDASATSVGAAPPISNTTGGPGAYTNLGVNVFVPFLLIARDLCSPWGWQERDFKGRALRLLENGQYWGVEKEFWTGTQAQASGWPNNYLCNSASYTDLTPVSAPPSVARGQQILQDALAQCGFGGQGMLHVQQQTTGNLLNVKRVGKVMLDIFDNIVVPGVGYDGICAGVGTPAAGTAVIFATDLVMTRVEEEGTVFPDSFAEALDRGQGGNPNLIEFRAEKHAAAYFDGACHFACRVTLAT